MHLTNAIIDEIDSAWADIAGQRLAELLEGNVKPVPLEEVILAVMHLHRKPG